MTCSCSLPEGDNCPPTQPYEEEKWCADADADAVLFKAGDDHGSEHEHEHGYKDRCGCKCRCRCRCRCELVRKSTKHSPECDNIFESTIPLLITATPRSGTVGTTQFLRALGLPLSDDAHAPTEFGMVSWIHCVRARTRARSAGDDGNNDGNNNNGGGDEYYGRVQLNGRGFATVLHQRRHVRKSITSLIYTTPFGTTPKRGRWSHELYKKFVGTHVPLDTTKSIEYMGLQMWVEWQLFVRGIADWHFRVEDLLSSDVSVSVPIVDRIFASADLPAPCPGAVAEALGRVDPKANTRKHRAALTWEEIFAIDETYGSIAYNLSKEYGYD